jgi:hypothetical protein
MDHEEAIRTKAAERYLLDELTPELRESFEEHAFDCPECTMDLRAGAAFVQLAKAELPCLAEPARAPVAEPRQKKSFLVDWFRPAFAVPVFAALLMVIAYQNLATIPNLRSAATAPRILPTTSFHAGTRGDADTLVQGSKRLGVALSIQLPQIYSSYTFTLYDPQGKQQWNTSVAAGAVEGADGTLSLFIPGQSLQNASYTLAISGVTAEGGRSEIERRVLHVQLSDN